MQLWRISDHRDLLGVGGLKANDRWHSRGSQVVYLAGSSTGALLEVLVPLEIDAEDIPDFFSLLTVEVPPELQVSELEIPAERDWKLDLNLTRSMGDAWLKAGETALARVPYSIIAESWNYLLNPEHPHAGLAKITKVTQERFNPRLFGFVFR